MAALFFGSVLGVGLAVLLEYFDTSFRTIADVETRLKLPVLGVIPFAREPMHNVQDNPADAEPFRVLHTNLNLTLKPGQASAFMLCSAGPGEGKSTLCMTIASSAAERPGRRINAPVRFSKRSRRLECPWENSMS